MVEKNLTLDLTSFAKKTEVSKLKQETSEYNGLIV